MNNRKINFKLTQILIRMLMVTGKEKELNEKCLKKLKIPTKLLIHNLNKKCKLQTLLSKNVWNVFVLRRYAPFPATQSFSYGRVCVCIYIYIYTYTYTH